MMHSNSPCATTACPSTSRNTTCPSGSATASSGGRRRSLLVDRAQMRYTAQSVLDAEDFMRQQADTGDEHTVDDRIIRRTLRRIEQANGHERRCRLSSR